MKQAKFGSSGIRGPFSDVATPQLALRLGLALAQDHRHVVVARDARLTGETLEQALVAGLMAGGATATRLGIVPTPTAALAARNHDMAVVITASHNPAPDNGFKLWTRDGVAFDAAQRARIEALLSADMLPAAAWNAQGQARDDSTASEAHIARIIAEVGPLAQPLRVVVDTGNGAASHLAPKLLTQLGAQVVTLNAQFDGSFPARPSEPNEANLEGLKRTTVAAKADLGIAHDGDADRMMLVTRSGRFVTGDELLTLFAQRYAPGTIACPVDASRMVDDASGCTVERTKVGDAYVSERLAQVGGVFGGEASGSWIFPMLSGCPDGPMAAAVACHLAVEVDLDKAIAQLPQYRTWRHAWHLDPAEVPTLMRDFEAALGDGDINRLDGIRSAYDDGWILVRPSGTEPKVRVTVEATHEDALKRLQARVAKVRAF